MTGLYAKRAALITAAGAAACGLAAEHGPRLALIVWAAAAAVACGVGAVLVRTSPVGRITWRNRLAGTLIPWGWGLNRGRLWPIVAASWVVWVAAGGAAVLLRPGAPDEPPSLGVRVALFAAWAVDAAALVFAVGMITQATPGGWVGPLWRLAAVIAGVIGASVALYLGGLGRAALLVAGGPPLAVAAGFGLVALVFLTAGRNSRWN